jgi:hypothetical protein
MSYFLGVTAKVTLTSAGGSDQHAILRLPLKNAVAKCHHANAIRDKCQWVRVM